MSTKINVVLPKKYDLVVGDTFQLFYRGVVEAVNVAHYDIVSFCEKGNNFPRYFEYTPEAEGEHVLKISVYGENRELLGVGETKLCVHAPKRIPTRAVNVICTGASITSDGIWVEEANRRITETGGKPEGHGLTGINFIGTCKRGKIGYEGYGGWQWKNYLEATDEKMFAVWITAEHKLELHEQHSVWIADDGNLWQLETITESKLKFTRMNNHDGKMPSVGEVLKPHMNTTCTDGICVEDIYGETKNPFRNKETQSIDFHRYCEKNGYEGIDAMYFLLGWNGLANLTSTVEEQAEKVVGYAKEFIDILHEQYPNARVKLLGLQIPSLNGGMGTNYGAFLPYSDTFLMVRYVFALNRAYERFALSEGYSDFVEFINFSGQYDSENNFPTVEKPVNTRSEKTEPFGVNGVHPTHAGKLQLADVLYRNLIKEFFS